MVLRKFNSINQFTFDLIADREKRHHPEPQEHHGHHAQHHSHDREGHHGHHDEVGHHGHHGEEGHHGHHELVDPGFDGSRGGKVFNPLIIWLSFFGCCSVYLYRSSVSQTIIVIQIWWICILRKKKKIGWFCFNGSKIFFFFYIVFEL